jgi:hypothetical protein
MVNNSTNLEVIVCFDIGGIVDHHCLGMIVLFVNIGGIVDHHCLEVIACFVDIDGIAVMVNNTTNINKTSNLL